jgi:beta-lactam-binding protein with PASTA domain
VLLSVFKRGYCIILRLRRLPITILKSGVLTVGVIATTGVSAFVTMRLVLAAQEVKVPDLVGRRTAEADAIAARHGLLIKIEGSRYDPEIERDHVVTQSPAAGTTLKSHRSIRLWLSRGRRQRSVPALEGMSIRTARLTLNQSGIPFKRVIEVDDDALEGVVLVQHPAPGETEDIGEGVSLIVSRGPKGFTRIMPDLIGLRAEDVLERLHAVGLKVAHIRYRNYPGVEVGIILRQTPSAGYPVNPRSSVSIELSSAFR